MTFLSLHVSVVVLLGLIYLLYAAPTRGCVPIINGYAASCRTMLYATGFSNGGMMAWQAGESLADRLAAIAPVAGQPLLGFSNQPVLKNGARISLIDVHGSSDVTCPPYPPTPLTHAHPYTQTFTDHRFSHIHVRAPF